MPEEAAFIVETGAATSAKFKLLSCEITEVRLFLAC